QVPNTTGLTASHTKTKRRSAGLRPPKRRISAPRSSRCSGWRRVSEFLKRILPVFLRRARNSRKHAPLRQTLPTLPLPPRECRGSTRRKREQTKGRVIPPRRTVRQEYSEQNHS